MAQSILRNPFSVEKMTPESAANIVICRSWPNAKINWNFEVFAALMAADHCRRVSLTLTARHPDLSSPS